MTIVGTCGYSRYDAPEGEKGYVKDTEADWDGWPATMDRADAAEAYVVCNNTTFEDAQRPEASLD